MLRDAIKEDCLYTYFNTTYIISSTTGCIYQVLAQ
jgi:hypothetical protein